MTGPIYRFGGFSLDASARELRRDGEPVALPPRAFACLLMLVEARERALGRDELIAALWNQRPATDVQLGQLVVQCRRALDDDGQTQWAIRTVAGFGYRWVAPTTVDADATAPAASAIESADRGEVFAPQPPASDPAPAVRRHRARSAYLFAIALALLAAAVAAVRTWHSRTPASPATHSERVVVLPLSVEEGAEAWLRLGGMDLVAERLRASGLAVQPSELTVGQLNSLKESGAMARQAPAAAIRRTDPSATIVEGTIGRHDGRWSVQIRADRADAPTTSATFDDATPTGAIGAAAGRLAAALGHVPAVANGGDTVTETLQRAQAALLANEPDAARDILLADTRLAHDTRRLRLQLAEVDIRAGRLDDARESLEAILAEPSLDPALRARALAARGRIAVRSGEYAEAGRWFDDGIRTLGDNADPQLVGRLHNGRAVSRTSLENYAAALVDYGVARDAFQRAGDEGGVARVDGNIGAMELLRGHPAQAEPYLTTAVARFETLGLVRERIGELQLLFEARRAQLDNTRAWEAMDASWAQRTRVPSRYSRLSMRLYRAQELLQQGRHNEVAELLDDPANDGRPADVAENERIRLLRAELDWRRGDGAAALAELDPVPPQPLESADSDLIRADVELLRARIERSLGRPARDGFAPPTGAANARTPIRLAAAANRAWADHRDDDAARSFADAYALAQSQGVPLPILRVAEDYVDFLLAHERTGDAAIIAAQVALWAPEDYDAALVQLAVAHAQGRRDAWRTALEQAHRLAGERSIPRALGVPPA